MRSKSFYKGVSLLIMLNLLIKPVWIFFIERKVQLIVGNEVYGTYFALLSFSIIFVFLADAGITNFLNQQMAAGVPVHFRQLLALKSLAVMLYTIVCICMAWLWGIRHGELMLYIIGVQVLTSMFVFLRAVISARQMFKQDAVLSVVDKSLMIILCGGFIYGIFGHINMLLFLQLQLLATFTAVIMAAIYITSRELLESATAIPYRHILQKVAPFAIIILLMSLHYRLDGFLLYKIQSAEQAGIYALAYRLVDAGNMIGYLAASFLVPFIAKNKNTVETKETMTGVLRAISFISMAALLFILFFPAAVQQILYHSSDAYINLVLQLAVASLPAYYVVHVYGSFFTAMQIFGPFMYALLIAVLVNFILNMLLIPDFGAAGTALAAVGSQYLCAGLLYIYWRRETRHVGV